MKKIAIVPIFISILINACSIADLNNTQGVVWSNLLDNPITVGLEQKNNNLFFADAAGSVYSVWLDSGSTRWKRTLSNEIITILYPATNHLYVFSHLSNASTTTFRKYTYYDGIRDGETVIEMVFKDGYYYDNVNLILHSSNQLAIINLSDETFTIKNYSSYLNNIKAVIKGQYSYYIIDETSKILKVNENWMTIENTITALQGNVFHGSALYYNNYLYLATENGIKILNTLSSSAETSLATTTIKYSPLVYDMVDSCFYVAFSGTSKRGIAKYSLMSASDSMTEQWFSSSFSAIAYSPIVFSDTLYALAYLDDGGSINVLDKRTGGYATSLYMGSINRPNLKILKDYYQNTIYIPVNTPSSKLFCFSLEFAMSAK